MNRNVITPALQAQMPSQARPMPKPQASFQAPAPGLLFNPWGSGGNAQGIASAVAGGMGGGGYRPANTFGAMNAPGAALGAALGPMAGSYQPPAPGGGGILSPDLLAQFRNHAQQMLGGSPAAAQAGANLAGLANPAAQQAGAALAGMPGRRPVYRPQRPRGRR